MPVRDFFLDLAAGFVHAQDRLTSMELARRAGAGRLAEVVGERAVPADRLMRLLDLRSKAQAVYDGLVASRACRSHRRSGVTSLPAPTHPRRH